MDTNNKLDNLKNLIKTYENVAIAFSAGVDSSFLLKVAHEVLGNRCIAITAQSPTFPDKELKAAKAFCEDLGVEQVVIHTKEMEKENFVINNADRCFHCKDELFSKALEITTKKNIPYLLDGFNKDDEGDFRPGRAAAKNLGVKSPLNESDMNKADIRDLSKDLGLATWDKPAFACLSSRFPYGSKITHESLEQVGNAEEFLRDNGLREVRVRHHGNTARIEAGQKEMEAFYIPEFREMVNKKFKSLGYLYITLDLNGYKSGSMNAALSQEQKTSALSN